MDRLSDCVVRVLESNLQNFRRYQTHGLLRKLHDTVGVHQDLNGPRGRAPAFQHLEEAEVLSVSRVTPHSRSQSVHPGCQSQPRTAVVALITSRKGYVDVLIPTTYKCDLFRDRAFAYVIKLK